MVEFPITVRVTCRTSPLIMKSVVPLGNQGVVLQTLGGMLIFDMLG